MVAVQKAKKLEPLLNNAKELEKRCDWLGAINWYEQALLIALKKEDSMKIYELFESEDPVECKKFIRVKKLRNQDYIKNPICLLKTNN